MAARFLLPAPLARILAAEAETAFPRECCGLIEGRWQDADATAFALHAIPNLAREPDRFELDPAAQIALLRRLRDSGGCIIGCYHSHPNGRAVPSARDADGASEDGFIWLIQPVAAGTTGAAAAFIFNDGAFTAMKAQIT